MAGKMRPSTTEEGREKQLVSLAIDLAEKQLRDGTASSQVISHYLKVGSTKEKKDMQLLDAQIQLANAKAESLKSIEKIEELYTKAMSKMGIYSGKRVDDEDE